MKRKGRKKKLLAWLLAMLMLVGVLPADNGMQAVHAATDFVGDAKIEAGTWAGWTWSCFGNSSTSAANTIYESEDGVITLKSTKGKIASKNEGINYLYYTLNATDDFVLKTRADVKSFDANSQVGFGLMLRAAVGQHDNTTDVSPLNSATVGSVGTDNSANVGSYRTDSGLTKYTSDAVTISAGEAYDLCIQKVGDVLNFQIDGVNVYTGSAAEIIKAENMYVGLFTARVCEVLYSNTSLDVMPAGQTISLVSQEAPSKTSYIQGNGYQDIDLSGFSAVVDVNGESRTITKEQCRLASYDLSGSTEQGSIVLDYYGTQITIPVEVLVEKVTDITIQYSPIKTEYCVGDTELDWTGLEGTVIYNSGVTKNLQDMLDEVQITYDFSQAGATEITIAYTYGGETKEAKIPVTVLDKSLTEIVVSREPKQTTFYKDVAVDADAYKKQLQITARYSDGSTKILSSGFEVVPVGAALDTATVGEYVYQVTYGGKTITYTLKVVERTIDGLAVVSYPNVTTYKVGDDFSAEGIAIEAVYDSGETKALTAEEFTVDASAFNKDAAGEYEIAVNATVDGQPLTTTFIVAVRDKVEMTYEDLEWTSVCFGQSTAKGERPTVTEEADGSKTILVELKEGVGKLSGGQDGIAYHYFTLDPSKDNFEITAKIKVHYFITKTAPDNGEAFGIMLRDSINTDGDSSVYYSNGMGVGGAYGNSSNVFGRYGILSQSDLGNMVQLQYNARVRDLTYQITEDNPQTYILTFKKDNTGIYATMTDEAGNIVGGIDNVMYPMPANTFSAIEGDKMYVGFMAARGAKIEINSKDVSVKVSAANADAPQVDMLEEKAATPSASVSSLKETGDEVYNLKTTVNVDGLITIKQNGQTIVNQKSVTAGTYEFPAALDEGKTNFQIYFEPDNAQNITSDAAVITNYTVTRKVYQEDAGILYVSPTGNSSGDGSKSAPLDLVTAITYCQSGQSIYMLEGTYHFDSKTGIPHENNGTANSYKTLMAEPGSEGKVIIDQTDKATGAASSNQFEISGDYWKVKGITFTKGQGVRIGGNYNLISNCTFVGNSNSGCQISRTDSANNIAEWPSYNEIISCISYNNKDASDSDADGFAAKLTCGVGNVFKYCVAAYNADDGWDLYAKGQTGPIGEVKIYDCVAFANGYLYNMETGEIAKSQGDGNGFKLGGEGIAVMHEIHDSYSFGNKTNGFTNNSNPWGVYENCTGYNNGSSNLELHIYTNAVQNFTIKNFKSYADDSYLQLKCADLFSATDTEAQESVISLHKDVGNYFYNADTKISANADGKQLTEANFVNLSEFVNYIEQGIAYVKRDENGAIALGDYLKYREVSGNGGNDEGGSDDSGNGSNSGSDENDTAGNSGTGATANGQQTSPKTYDSSDCVMPNEAAKAEASGAEGTKEGTKEVVEEVELDVVAVAAPASTTTTSNWIIIMLAVAATAFAGVLVLLRRLEKEE